MSSPITCPDSTQLKGLLTSSLPESEQAKLASHLETCEICQQTLDGLAADQESWAGIAQQLKQPGPPPETALQAALEKGKNNLWEGATRLGAINRDGVDLSFLSPPNQADQLGCFGPYEILEVIGTGGMGIVLKGLDPTLNRIEAIKVLAPQLASTAIARKRFIREAQAAAAIAHEHVVGIHAVAEANGLPYLVMQYVAGQSLQDKLDHTGPLGLADIVRIGKETALGLSAAHAQSLVHRDIKPANILLEGLEEKIKLTDFGLARAVDDASVSHSGVVAGTPQYMAPEQARGEEVDLRSDLFSLGSVLYAMCTGQAPFRGSNPLAVLYSVCEEIPAPIASINPTIPDWLLLIIEKLQAKKSSERFQSAREVAELLAHYLAFLKDPTGVPPPSQEPSASRSQKGRTMTLVKCLDCGKDISDQAAACPHCGRVASGYEYRSETTIFGIPLIHIVTGYDPVTRRPRTAKGIIAIGDRAIGVLAFGGLAFGGVAFGGGAMGLIAIGGGAMGLLLAIGGVAAGGFAMGGAAIGGVAVGGLAIGYYALGGGAFGVHTFGPQIRDPQAIQFFRHWFGYWFESLNRPR